ncbi:MAG: patatin-like phospholipase family protein [Pseudomonadota bacterium]|nr:patatin-like phospholipase family protein [Pseudomonadota bacterium]
MERREQLRILSIDGGGIRGFMTAVWLHQLQMMLAHPTYRYFHVFTGTSTGSLLTCALGLGMTTLDILRHYQRHGEKVFPKGFARLLNQFQRMFREGLAPARYDNQGLEIVLTEIFEDRRFGEIPTRTLVSAVDNRHERPMIFDSADPNHQDLLIRDICLASAALPTVFPPKQIDVPIQGLIELIDGGMFDRNPSLQAVAHLAEFGQRDPADYPGCLLASFGTGLGKDATPERLAAEAPASAPDLSWMIDPIKDRLGLTVSHRLETALRRSNYFRFQTMLEPELAAADQAGHDHIHGLLRAAQRFLVEQGGNEKIKELARVLEHAVPE